MTVDALFDLWCDEDFRAEVKGYARDASRKWPWLYKDFVAEAWIGLSWTKDNRSVEWYLQIAKWSIEGARRKEIERRIEARMKHKGT